MSVDLVCTLCLRVLWFRFARAEVVIYGWFGGVVGAGLRGWVVVCVKKLGGLKKNWGYGAASSTQFLGHLWPFLSILAKKFGDKKN